MCDNIEYPYKDALGAKKIKSFPNVQQEKIEEIIDTINCLSLAPSGGGTLNLPPQEYTLFTFSKAGYVLDLSIMQTYLLGVTIGSVSVNSIIIPTNDLFSNLSFRDFEGLILRLTKT